MVECVRIRIRTRNKICTRINTGEKGIFCRQDRWDGMCSGSVVLFFLAVQYNAVFVQPSHLNPQLPLPSEHLRSQASAPLGNTHRRALSTNFCSNLATSALKASTCSQQSKGLRSFNLKHCTKPSFAFSRFASALLSAKFLRRSSLLRSSATSFDTLSLLRSLDCEDEGVSAEESFSLSEGEEEESEEESCSSEEGVRRSVYWARRAASSLRMRSSSSVTRCWIWSSRLRWRVESVLGLSQN